MNIYEKLSNIQNELKVPKAQNNTFGGYKFRSCEDILEAVKPICMKYKVVLTLSDTLENIGDRYYIKAIAKIVDIEEPYEDWGEDCKAVNCITNVAYARESETKKGMDDSQITGTASSYARKYALNGLFDIDDTKDADTDEFTKITQEKEKLENEKITAKFETALRSIISKNEIPNEQVIKVLAKYGYARLNEIELKNYKKICDELGG